MERYLRKLDQELSKFKMELEADNAGITEVLERRMYFKTDIFFKVNRFKYLRNLVLHPMSSYVMGDQLCNFRKMNPFCSKTCGVHVMYQRD